MGRLTKDPSISYSKSNDSMEIARFTLAVDRRTRQEGNQQTADFISCVCFGRQAEFVEKYLRQGTKVAVTGHIQTGSYTDSNGKKVYTTDVVLDDVEFAESKNAGNREEYSAPDKTGMDSDGFMNIPDGMQEELPFM